MHSSLRHGLSVGLVLASVMPSGVLAADAYDELRKHIDTFEPVMQQMQDDQEREITDLEASTGEEFFPETPEEKELGREAQASAFVIFRIAGVPYELKDVLMSAWFAPYVRDVAERGIVSGYKNAEGVPLGIFGPERNVSIEELGKMAIEAAALPRTGCGEPKNPAALKSWSKDYIACTEQAGFAVYGDGTVDIKRPATRAEVVMTILQAFGAQLTDFPAESPFTDVSASTLFSSAIYTASQANIVAGYSDANGNPTGKFGPENPVNRAEVAKILSLGLQLYGK
jgi:hypothetical protein